MLARQRTAGHRASRLALPQCGKKTVGLVQMGPQTQISRAAQGVGLGHPGMLEHRGRIQRHEPSVRRSEPVRHRFVFFAQQAACGIDQTPARLDQQGRLGQYALLERGHGGHGLDRQSPFQIRAAPEGSQSAAGGIHQHPIDLARQPLQAGIAFMGQCQGLHIRQATALQPGFEGIEPVRRGIEGIQATLVAHQRPQSQGFAACTGTEIDHRIGAARLDQQRQQLRAFVLHLQQTVLECGQGVQRGLAHQPQAPRGVARWSRIVACLPQLL